jgi:hypothetical protein
VTVDIWKQDDYGRLGVGYALVGARRWLAMWAYMAL